MSLRRPVNYYRNEIIRVPQKIIKYEKTEKPYKYLNKSELMLVVNLISVQQRKRRSFIFLWSCWNLEATLMMTGFSEVE